MQKLPEFIALGIGFGLLGLAGSIAWTTLEPQGMPTTAQARHPSQQTSQQAGVLPTARP